MPGVGKIEPEPVVNDLLHDLQQVVRRGKDRLNRLGILLKELERYAKEPERYAFVLKERLLALDRSSEDLREFEELPDRLSRLSSELSSFVEQELQRARSTVTTALARDLGQKGLELSGNFPLLSCGVLTLEFAFQAGGKVTLYFGPRIEKLQQVPIESEAIAKAVLSLYGDLEGEGFDEGAYIGTLFKAYHVARHVLGCEAERPVPITDIMFQTAILKQDKKFRNDPVRTNFAGYGRTRFAYDLSRTKIRSIDNFELHLTVASMEQTKHPETHLWVPQSPKSPKGTHFSMLAFRQVGSR